MADWELRGRYWDICSCTVPCPCWVGHAAPTEGQCHFLKVASIERGLYGGLNLSDLVVATVGSLPGHIQDEKFEVGLYISAEATNEQFTALRKIFGGEAGGPMGGKQSPIGTFKGAKRATITLRPYPVDAWVWRFGEYAEAAGAPIWGTNGKPMVLQNAYLGSILGIVGDPVINKHRVMKVNDAEWGYQFEYRNRSAYVAKFQWSGSA